MMRKISGPKREDVTEAWRKMRNGELHNLSSSPNAISIIKSWSRRWPGRVECMVQKRNGYEMLMEKDDG
jgi:hypothetical protein